MPKMEREKKKQIKRKARARQRGVGRRHAPFGAQPAGRKKRVRQKRKATAAGEECGSQKSKTNWFLLESRHVAITDVCVCASVCAC